MFLNVKKYTFLFFCLFFSSSSFCALGTNKIFVISLMSPTGKLEISSRVEEKDHRFFSSSLASGKSGFKIGEAISLRLEKAGALINASSADGVLKGVVVRVVPDSDGTPSLVPMSFETKMPTKGGTSSVLLPDGSTLSLSLD